MPIITRTEITALAHCAMQVSDGELVFDAQGGPGGDERCPGYGQQRVPAVREVVQFLFADGQGGSSDPMDAMVSRMVERSTEHLHFADEADRPCPFCGHPRALSEQVRPQYSRIGGARGGPDALFADRRARRDQVEAAQTAASAAERQAQALEALVGQGEVTATAELAELRAELADLRQQLEHNGEPEPVPPRPRRRSTAA
jgi:hypothetical protein